MLSGPELLIALVAVVVGATIMGTVSFGMGLVVVPVLLLFLAPKSAVVTVNAIIPILLCFVLLTTWRHLEFRRLRGMALGGVLAVPLGVLTLESANPTLLKITIGLAILCLGFLNLFNIRLPLAAESGKRFAYWLLDLFIHNHFEHRRPVGGGLHYGAAVAAGTDAGCVGFLLPLRLYLRLCPIRG